MLKVALTHDVDRTSKHYQYVSHLLRSIASLNIGKTLYHLKSMFVENPYWNFPVILAIEKSFNVRSTFFFLNESIRFNPLEISNWKLSLGRYDIHSNEIVRVIKTLDEHGWEIGMHGSYHSYRDKTLLEREKKTLEHIVGHEIIGIRQHYLNLNEKTWEYQRELGFKYDASFGNTREIGFKDNRFNVFFPFDDNFMVAPLVVMDINFMKTSNKWKEFNRIVDIAEGKNGLLVINWHQRVFNENEFVHYSKCYIRIIKECLLLGAKFYTLSDYYGELIASK